MQEDSVAIVIRLIVDVRKLAFVDMVENVYVRGSLRTAIRSHFPEVGQHFLPEG
jgi:hypothetical protein